MVTVADVPEVSAGFTSDPTLPATLDLTSASSVDFTNGSLNATSYAWDFGDGNTSTLANPNHGFTDPGEYCITLIATNDNGCTDTSLQCGLVIELIEFEYPNTFTPNGDGINDLFEITGIENYPQNNFMVFNRWGNKVYEKDGYDNTWDGRNGRSGLALPDGAYFWVLKRNDDTKDLVGEVVIFR